MPTDRPSDTPANGPAGGAAEALRGRAPVPGTFDGFLERGVFHVSAPRGARAALVEAARRRGITLGRLAQLALAELLEREGAERPTA